MQGAQHGVQEAAQEEQEEVQRPQGRIGPLSMKLGWQVAANSHLWEAGVSVCVCVQ